MAHSQQRSAKCFSYPLLPLRQSHRFSHCQVGSICQFYLLPPVPTLPCTRAYQGLLLSAGAAAGSGQEAEQVAPRKQGKLVPALHCPRFIFLVLGFYLRCLGDAMFLPSHHRDYDACILFQEPVLIHRIVCGSNGFTVVEANKRSNLMPSCRCHWGMEFGFWGSGGAPPTESSY